MSSFRELKKGEKRKVIPKILRQIIKITKESKRDEIQSYFEKILELKNSGKEFPVNLEEVWPLVYTNKNEAVRSLRESLYTIENVDYQVLRRNAENPKGGRPTEDYYLTVSCLEFFIARKVRSVFEVYRQVFHKVVEQLALIKK